ncbi:hypothetical protein MFMK1_000375 [Metallumcola ferriviriculae]|uniref:Cytochrome c-552/4 domain-containing protein n=1 Tax=Metallumcola ferriviriculae TaxID=3039180 RepID=A0AAU0UJA6_9FIRM|nr:hypothetical protein MFMK1_000375 [Desulfitibacteraceae bacterium MK1]
MSRNNWSTLIVIVLMLVLAVAVSACANTNNTNTKNDSEQKQAAENEQAQKEGDEGAGEEQQSEPPRRGCAACHVKTADNDYSLTAEAKSRAEGHPTKAPDGTTMDENTTVETCLECHAPGNNGRGKSAPLALRTIVHPAHLYSEHFVANYSGNCFTCHEVDNQGVFNLLSQKVETNEKGVPKTVPIPGMIAPSERIGTAGTPGSTGAPNTSNTAGTSGTSGG